MYLLVNNIIKLVKNYHKTAFEYEVRYNIHLLKRFILTYQNLCAQCNNSYAHYCAQMHTLENTGLDST